MGGEARLNATLRDRRSRHTAFNLGSRGVGCPAVNLNYKIADRTIEIADRSQGNIGLRLA